jgi:hypothetical protein
MGGKLIGVVLALLFACGVVLLLLGMRSVSSITLLPWPMWAFLLCPSVVPAIGLLVWWRTSAGPSLGVNTSTVVAALVGAVSSALLLIAIVTGWGWGP